MDLSNFLRPSASPKPAPTARSLRGLTLKPVTGWENCAPPITVVRNTTRSVGRRELHAQGTIGISKLHCTLEARAACLVLTATATFNVIVVHTFTGEDKSVETFRRLEKGEQVSLEPGDRIYMAVDPVFDVAQAPPPRECCKYAFKVVAATADEVSAAAAAAGAAAAASTTPSCTPAPNVSAAAAASTGSTNPSTHSLTPLGKRSASGASLRTSGSPKVPKPRAASTAGMQSPDSPMQAAAHSGDKAAGIATQPAGASLARSSAPATDGPQKKKTKKSRLLRELESDRGYVGSAQCSPEEASKLGRRQRRRTSASSSEELSPPKSVSPNRAASAGPGRAQTPASDKSKGKSMGKAAAQAKAGAAAASTAASSSGQSSRTMTVTGESRKAQRDDIDRRVEVLWATGKSAWYGGTIRGFVKDKFRVEYDDGSLELEELHSDGTFFPDPVEETRCRKPPKPSELALVQDPQLNMPLVCRVVGARPDGGMRVRFIGWSRQHDRTCWTRSSDKQPSSGGYLLDMTKPNKQKAARLNSQINTLDKAQGDTARARIGSLVTAEGMTNENRVIDVAIRQTSAKSNIQMMYLLADKQTWVPECKLLTVDGQLLMPNKPAGQTGHNTGMTDGAASAHSGSAAAAVSPDSDAAAAAPTTVKRNPKSSTKVTSEVHLVAAYEEEWSDLTVSEQEAASALGWTAEQWGACQDPQCREQPWDELTSAQRKAAATLGWDPARWASASTVTPSSLKDSCTVADRTFNVRRLSLRVPLCPASRRRSASWEELEGNQAQHMKLELDEAVGEDGDVMNLPSFLHFVEHNAHLGHVPPKSVYDKLLSQLVDAGTNAGAASLVPSVIRGDENDADAQSQTFSQEMEAEVLAENTSRSRRIATQAQSAVYATLHELLNVTSHDASNGRGRHHFAGWSAVSVRKGGEHTTSGPRQEDFQRFERILSAIYGSVRTAAQHASSTPTMAAPVDACSGAALYLDYTTSVLASSRLQVGTKVPEGSMIWQLLYATNPSGSEGQIKQVLQLCIGIVEAASGAFATNDKLVPCTAESNGAAGAALCHLWIAVIAAQKLLGLAVAVGATSYSSNVSATQGGGGGGGVVIAPAQSSLLYQQYLERLTTPQSKKLFFETLSHPALQMHMLDRVLCPGKQQHQPGSGAAIWKRIFSWAHCPPQLRVSAATSSLCHATQAGSSAAQPTRERIERLLVLYSAAQVELQQAKRTTSGEAGLALSQPPVSPEGFIEDLEAQQAHLRELLLTAGISDVDD